MMSSSSAWSCHPTQLSSVSGQVVVLYSQAGVLAVAGHCQIYCFFTRAQVWGEGDCSIRVGEEVMVNARLVPPLQRNEMVPYLATTIWRDGCQLPSALSLRLLSPHTTDELQHYQETVPGLLGLLPDSMEDKRVGYEVDRLGSSQVMQGIFVSRGVREKEGGGKAKRDQHPEEIESHAEFEPKKRKKRSKSSTSEDEPVKHLDCLHKINDIIAELEKKVATDPPKITKPVKPDPLVQPEVISYPQPGVAYSLNRPTSPHNIGFPNPNKLSTAPAWLGLTVAPGSVSTAIHPVSNPLVPSKHTEADIDEMSEEEDESPIKKSLFTDIFDHDERPMSPENDTHHMMAANKTVKNDSRRDLGVKLSNLLQDRILNKTRGKDIGLKHRREKVDNSRDRTTSQSRSRSREINISQRARNVSSSEEKSKADRRHLRKKSRSRSRFKSGSKKRHHSRSRSRFIDKERSKKKRKSRSRSRFSDIDEEKMRKTIEKKKRKSRSRSRFNEKERPKKKKSSSRSKFSEKERSKNKTSRSRSRQKDKRSNKKRSQSRSKSQSRQKKTDSSRKQSRSKSHNSRSSSSSDRSKRGNYKKIKRSCYPNQQNKTNRSDSRQKGLNRKKKDHEKKSGKDEINRKQSNDSKDRKERSNSKTTERRQQGSKKFEKKNEDVKDKDDLRNYIDKLKRKEDSPKHEKHDLNLNTTQSDCDTDASEEEMIIRKRRLNRTKFLAAFKDKKKEEPEVNSNKIKMNEPDEDNIPIAFFEQPVEAVDGDDDASLQVVFFDAEVLHDGSSTHILQLGANASVLDKAFTFFKYMQPNLLQGDQLEQLNSDAKFELMDSLRLKTSKFDVTHSGKLNLYFKHPELGNIISEKERDVLISFISFLRSVKPGKPVILVTHRKDTVLPALLSLLTKHDLLAQFSPLVSQCCELVHLAWELHMDHLWQGARYPGLRSVAEFVDKDLQWDDGYLPCDKISFLLSWLVGKMRREHKLVSLDRFVEQCGGVGVMDYMTVKYNLVQTASGCRGGVERPGHVEVVRGSDQWGRKMRIDLKWKEDAVFTEERSNRRTPLPEPDSLLNDGEHHIRILKPGESKQFSAKTSVGVTAWSDKSYNTYLPPGVVKISPLSTTSILLRIPALKPRISELLGISVLVQQNQEFTHCRILKSTEVLTQPKNSMFPIVEAMLENTSKEEISLDSKIINFAVASIKIDDKYEA